MKKTAPVLLLAFVVVILMVVYSGFLKDFIGIRAGGHGAEKEIAQRLKVAGQYIKEGNLEAAKDELASNLKLSDYEESTFYWLSLIYLQEDDFDRAFEFGKKFVEKSVNSQLLTDLGSAFAMRGFDKMAFVCYGKVLNEDPNYIAAYIELGKLYGNQEKFVQAISVWQDALRLDPDNTEIKDLITQAHALLEQGHKENYSATQN